MQQVNNMTAEIDKQTSSRLARHDPPAPLWGCGITILDRHNLTELSGIENLLHFSELRESPAIERHEQRDLLLGEYLCNPAGLLPASAHRFLNQTGLSRCTDTERVFEVITGRRRYIDGVDLRVAYE